MHELNAAAPWRPAPANARALAGLTLLVLAVHLWLLTDRLPGWPGDGSTATVSEAASGDTRSAAEAPASADIADDIPEPVSRSTVRWIVLRSPPPPPPARPGTPTRPPPPTPEATLEAVAEPSPEPTEAPSWTAEEAVPPEPAETTAAVTPVEEPPTTPPEVETARATAGAADPATESTGADTTTDQGPAGSAPDLGGTAASAELQLAPHVPPSATLQYAVSGQVKGLQYSASATVQWQHDGQRYQARSEVRAFLLGSRSQTSVGQIGAWGIAPERFGDRSRQERAAHFDAAQQRVRFSNNAPEAPLRPGTQDQLTASLQLATLLRGVPATREPGHVLRVPVASTSSVEVWRFEVGALESLDLPAGRVLAHKITRGPRREFDKTIELWLAPDHAYLPVRMRITEHNGNEVDQQLSQWPGLVPKPADP